MESAIEYLARMHRSIKNDYQTPDGEHIEHCFFIASELASILLSEGKSPEIIRLQEDAIDDSCFDHLKVLKPKIYDGRVTWTCHFVCGADGLAYDPIIGEPVPLNDYCRSVFGEDIKMETEFSTEKLGNNFIFKIFNAGLKLSSE